MRGSSLDYPPSLQNPPHFSHVGFLKKFLHLLHLICSPLNPQRLDTFPLGRLHNFALPQLPCWHPTESSHTSWVNLLIKGIAWLWSSFICFFLPYSTWNISLASNPISLHQTWLYHCPLPCHLSHTQTVALSLTLAWSLHGIFNHQLSCFLLPSPCCIRVIVSKINASFGITPTT